MNPDSPERAKALMLAHSPHIRHAMGDRDPGVYGAVILASGVAVGDRTSAVFELVPELRALRNGSAFAVTTLDVMRDLAARLRDVRAAALLSEPVTPGYTWTMVVMPRTLAVAPLGRPEAPPVVEQAPRAPLDASGLATFLRRWPETAHLAARLDPKPGARGKVTFDLGVTIGALEEFVQLIDALSIAHPDMRSDADKARGALPALRAKLRQAAN